MVLVGTGLVEGEFMVREVDEDDEDAVECGDAFTWLASGTDVTSDAPAGAVFAIVREAADLAEAGDAEAAEEAFARAAALAVTVGEAALLPELADVVATTLAPLDTTRSLALLRRWQGEVDALDEAGLAAQLLDARAHVAMRGRVHGVAALLLDEARLAWTAAGADRRAAELTDYLARALRFLGRGEEALARHAEARAVFESLEALDAAGISAELAGDCCTDLARHEEALANYSCACACYRQVDSPHDTARARDRMGMALNHLGRFAESEEAHLEAIAGFADLGELELEAEARKNLGWTLGDLGRDGDARAALLDALEVLDAAGWTQAADEAREGLDRLPEPHPTDGASGAPIAGTTVINRARIDSPGAA